jgi:CDP-paratose 2-epimerase
MRCLCTGRPYTVYGYGGKQVRDVIHGSDVAAAFEQVAARPIPGAVYNIGGGREASCSLLEAIECCERVAGKELEWSCDERGRTGDHAWWISDTSAFTAAYPEWSVRRGLESIVEELHAACHGRWPVEPAAG